MKFYKILDESENHNGLQFRDGRVDDTRSFKKRGSCVPGGIYFAPVTSILAFVDYGPWIREVTIPDDAKMVKDPGYGPEKYRASSVVLGPRERWADPEVLRRLIAEGADVHARGDFALRWSAANGYVEAVRVLLETGADVHAGDDLALQWAANNGHTETVRTLLDAGADVRAWNDYALRMASQNGHTETVRTLLDAGADVHALNDYALRWAAENGHTETVQVLVEAGASLD